MIITNPFSHTGIRKLITFRVNFPTEWTRIIHKKKDTWKILPHRVTNLEYIEEHAEETWNLSYNPKISNLSHSKINTPPNTPNESHPLILSNVKRNIRSPFLAIPSRHVSVEEMNEASSFVMGQTGHEEKNNFLANFLLETQGGWNMQKGCIVFREATCAKTLPINSGGCEATRRTREPREETIGRGSSRGEARSVKVGA